MTTILELICEYRTLKMRRNMGGQGVEEGLTFEESRRLGQVERALGFRASAAAGAIGHGSERRRFTRAEVEIPATIEVGDIEHLVLITNLSGGGLVLRPAPAIERGELAVVRVIDPANGEEVRLPAQAVWTSEDSAVGLNFVGTPAAG